MYFTGQSRSWWSQSPQRTMTMCIISLPICPLLANSMSSTGLFYAILLYLYTIIIICFCYLFYLYHIPPCSPFPSSSSFQCNVSTYYMPFLLSWFAYLSLCPLFLPFSVWSRGRFVLAPRQKKTGSRKFSLWFKRELKSMYILEFF